MDKKFYLLETAQCAHFDHTRLSLAYLRAENEFRGKWETSGYLAILERSKGHIYPVSELGGGWIKAGPFF